MYTAVIEQHANNTGYRVKMQGVSGNACQPLRKDGVIYRNSSALTRGVGAPDHSVAGCIFYLDAEALKPLELAEYIGSLGYDQVVIKGWDEDTKTLMAIAAAEGLEKFRQSGNLSLPEKLKRERAERRERRSDAKEQVTKKPQPADSIEEAIRSLVDELHSFHKKAHNDVIVYCGERMKMPADMHAHLKTSMVNRIKGTLEGIIAEMEETEPGGAQ